MAVIVKAPAKINLLLKVVGARPDGLHELRSVFQKVDICDTITVESSASGGLTLECDLPGLPVDETNLVLRAGESFRKITGTKKGAHIKLGKRIPVSAGLGGGSSDAAGAIIALAKLWGIDLSQDELATLGFGIGADVPFFLGAAPMAWVEGAGEKVSPLSPEKSLPLLVVNPGFGVSAGDVYSKSCFALSGFERAEDMISDFESGQPKRIAPHLENDLAPWVMEHYPELAELKRDIESAEPRPAGVMMSGSGPTLFAIYSDMDTAGQARRTLAGRAPTVIATRTLLAQADPCAGHGASARSVCPLHPAP